MGARGPKFQTPEARALISASSKLRHAEGRGASPEAIGAGMRLAFAEGRWSPPCLSGESHGKWKGDAIKYRAAHRRVVSAKGNPSRCEHCQTEEPSRFYDWALLHDATTKLIDKKTGLSFSPDPDDYIRLCRSCHRAYDHPMEAASL